jgi:hypothetical protein
MIKPVKELRYLIEEAGLQSADCVERSELAARAAEAQEILARKGGIPVDPAIGDDDEVYECDVGDSEVIGSDELTQLMLPDGRLPIMGGSGSSIRDFSISVSSRAFDGWVKQPSPCCAAASVAGAFNAARAKARGDDEALSTGDVLSTLITMIQAQIQTKRVRFESIIGAPVQPLIDEVQKLLESDGKSLGGKRKGDSGVGRGELMRAVRRVVETQNSPGREDNQAENRSDNDNFMQKVCDKVAFPLIEAVKRPFRKEVPAVFGVLAEKFKAAGAAADDDQDDDDADDGEGEPDVEILRLPLPTKQPVAAPRRPGQPSAFLNIKRPGRQRGKQRRAQKVLVQPGWRKPCWLMFKKIAGLNKLLRKHPSTGAFGNWGLFGSAEALAGKHGVNVKCSCFMGRNKSKNECTVVLDANDSAYTKTEQWRKLRECVMRPRSAIIFHLTNHYALIFALREWTDTESNKQVRQVLTARKGQRPSAWIDFEEARETMLKWPGYKLLRVEHAP